MLRYLFGGLTSDKDRSRALFEALVAEARRPHWYRDGEVPDSVDGRFAMLATVVAIATVRLERGSEQAHAASVGLAERFVEAMDSEHREMGIGDPALGKHVRKLVTALGRRVEEWRAAAEDEARWRETVRSGVYRGTQPAPSALGHSEQTLRELWWRLEAASDEALAEGRFG